MVRSVPRGKMLLGLCLIFVLAPAATAQPVRSNLLRRSPLTQNGGTWDSGHVQGIAIDLQGGFIYYSFTDLLAKYDFGGRLVGTPRDIRVDRSRFEKLKEAYVKARYSKHFRISDAELSWLSERVQTLGQAVQVICEERIAALEKSAAA
jgi:hypothetical protein